MNRLYSYIILSLCAVFSSAQQNYRLGIPGDSRYVYLNNYANLKDYIDYASYPNFRLGIAISADDYNKQGQVSNLVNDNFTEVVTGNDMKMSSCVNSSGTMNFTTVKDFVSKASSKGLDIYGHTLAWHSQQAVGWLNSLIKDRPASEADCDTTVYVTLASKDFTKDKTYGWNADQTQFKYSLSFDSNGLKVHTAAKSANFWDVQYIVMDNIPTEKNKSYKVTITIKATGSGTLHAKLGDWNSGNTANINFTGSWKDVTCTYSSVPANAFLLCQSGDFVGDIWIKQIKIEYLKKGIKTKDAHGNTVVEFPQSVPLSDKEKKDTLVYAMDKWIKGIMTATDGKVKAWDVVNEAISGGNPDREGVFALQHRTSESNAGDFFWQDYLGDIEYVRQAVRLARKHYKGNGDELKLFINDYNLESDWDQNGKLKSLIKWIERWEADGNTHIDGIGSQMHISCYMNNNIQSSKKQAIENSFRLMARTGKLVRISELDMNMIDANGNDVPTGRMTEEMHHRMADLYEWIIRKYLEIIPADQQWGICQWCATDSPAGSGWRPNSPVGIWNLNYYRKHAYAGFANGLGGVVSSTPQICVSGGQTPVYNLSGQRMSVSIEELPSGFYITDGKLIWK